MKGHSVSAPPQDGGPDTPTQASSWRRSIERLISAQGYDFPAVLAFLICAVGIVIKAPDALLDPQFWAEDGVIFFEDQWNYAWPLFKPYATYLHLTPRLVAKAASLLPSRYAPPIYCWTALLIGTLSLVSLRHIRLGKLPYLVVLAGFFLTPTNGESIGIITNIQSMLQFYLLSVLGRLANGDQSRAPWLRAAAAFVVGMTGPFGIFALCGGGAMIVTSQLLSRRSPVTPRLRMNGELWALAMAGGIQLFTMLSAAGEASPSRHTLKGALRLLSAVQLHTLTVEPLPRAMFRILLLVLIGAALVKMKDARSRLLFLSILVFALIEYLGVLRKFPGDASLFVNRFESGDRYFVVPKALVVWTCASVILESRLAPRLQRALTVVAVALPAVLGRSHLVRRPLPDLHWNEHADRLDRGDYHEVHVAPSGWTIRVRQRED